MTTPKSKLTQILADLHGCEIDGPEDCPVKDWTEQKLQHPKDCRDCNGHGTVWVRKEGV